MLPEALLKLIKRFEGLRLKPYICPAGVPTIGYGSTRYLDGKPVRMSDPPITYETAVVMMNEDARRFTIATLKLSPVLALDENRLAAIADFCYNLGATRYKASTLKRKVDAQDWDAASKELIKWVWGGGKKLPGLVARRQAEIELIK